MRWLFATTSALLLLAASVYAQTATLVFVGTYAQVSAASPSLTGLPAVINDCADASCTAGGGSLECIVEWDGAAWLAVACGGTPYAFASAVAYPVACSASFSGSTFYDTTAGALCYCNATNWVYASDNSTTCTTPAANYVLREDSGYVSREDSGYIVRE